MIQCSSSWDDLNQSPCNHSLASSIVCQSQLVNLFTFKRDGHSPLTLMRVKFFCTSFGAEILILWPNLINKSYNYGKIEWLLNEHGIANASRNVGNFYKKTSFTCNFAIQYLRWLAIPYNLGKATFDWKHAIQHFRAICNRESKVIQLGHGLMLLWFTAGFNECNRRSYNS